MPPIAARTIRPEPEFPAADTAPDFRAPRQREKPQRGGVGGCGLGRLHDRRGYFGTQQIIDELMRQFDAAALAQDGDGIGVAGEALRGKRIRELAGRGRDRLAGRHRPRLRRARRRRQPTGRALPRSDTRAAAASARWPVRPRGAAMPGSPVFTESPIFLRHAPKTSGGSSSMVIFPAQARVPQIGPGGVRLELLLINDAGGPVHVGDAPVQAAGPTADVRNAASSAPDSAADRWSQRLRASPSAIIGGSNSADGKTTSHPRVAAHHLGEHFLRALIGSVAHAHAEFALEIRDGGGRDVIGPVVNIEPAFTAPARMPCGRAPSKNRRRFMPTATFPTATPCTPSPITITSKPRSAWD